MKVVVVGSGAREHALIHKLKSERQVKEVLAIGTNAGIAQDVEVLSPLFNDVSSTIKVISSVRPDLVVIGPEAPLVAGLADGLVGVGINTFGPTAAAARLESSKSFAKEVMAQANITTAWSNTCHSIAEVATALDARRPPFVVKDDALASGKGVVVTADRAVALDHARSVLNAYNTVLIEDHLTGVEASLFFVCDGQEALPLLPARDHKRLASGDLGPNTGGMGSYAPLGDFSFARAEELAVRIAKPILAQMTHRGTPFVGVLYAGLMIDDDEVNVVEFNVRFGDPETQSVLALMTSPISELLLAACRGDLSSISPPTWQTSSVVTVVLAAPGYPVKPITGTEISGLNKAAQVPGVRVFHAGTRPAPGVGVDKSDVAIVEGGRALSISAVGENLDQARMRAYQAVNLIDFDGVQFRDDIGVMPSQEADNLTTERIRK